VSENTGLASLKRLRSLSDSSRKLMSMQELYIMVELSCVKIILLKRNVWTKKKARTFYLAVYHFLKYAEEDWFEITSHFNTENLPLIPKNTQKEMFKARIQSMLENQSDYLNHKQIWRSLKTSETKTYISGSQSGGRNSSGGGARDFQGRGKPLRRNQILNPNLTQIIPVSCM
jgi:hypothetical protein